MASSLNGDALPGPRGDVVVGRPPDHRGADLLLPVRARAGHRPRAGLPESYNKVIETYKNPIVNLIEVGLVAAVIYHALNGMRIMLVDFWSKGRVPAADALDRHRRSGSLLIAPFAIRHLMHVFEADGGCP